jgi:hypothetical protein
MTPRTSENAWPATASEDDSGFQGVLARRGAYAKFLQLDYDLLDLCREAGIVSYIPQALTAIRDSKTDELLAIYTHPGYSSTGHLLWDGPSQF